MPIKTDRRDAEGIARRLHLGRFKPVHLKSVSAQEVRAVLGARKAIQQGMIALEMSMPGHLRNVGLEVIMHRGRTTWLRTWSAQVARSRGGKRAMVALARRISVILHRMWVDDTNFQSDSAVPQAA